MALTQRCVTNFVVLILRRICLTLEYAVLDVLIVSKDLGDSQRPGFVDYGTVQHRCLIIGDPDSRPSAMTLVLVRVTVWLGIEGNDGLSPGCQGVPAFL